MNLIQYYNEKVKIVDDEGNIFVGTVNDYIYPEDNEPERESVIVDTDDGEVLEFYEKIINKIEIIKSNRFGGILDAFNEVRRLPWECSS